MAELTLCDFISDTLKEIAKGVAGANEGLVDYDNGDYEVYSLRDTKGDDKISGIKFDIAVKAVKNQQDKAGIVVALASLGGGASTTKEGGRENVHRIQFEIGIERDFTKL
ncbi:hypothetical protein A3197_03320 [Candidatus Thiodiazotropha endoloripes]|nr:hypothetical protein A3197_03320 [Candidatus Thiodiazotropha endoloripes]